MLQRETFRTSRLLDFCSRKELTAQTGHAVELWHVVALKELADNAIDSCEDAEIAPAAQVVVDADGITVSDNGPGIPPETVAGVLDFSIRVSSRECYVSPCRGAQGNALKTIVAMPFVLHGEQGRIEITARGVRHDITIGVDRIKQEPRIHHQPAEDRLVKNGTLVRLCWPDSSRSILTDCRERFLQIAEDFAVLNPHLTLSVDWFGERMVEYKATTTAFKKWLPHRPTSAHWYLQEHFDRYVAACIAADAEHESDRTCREFVATFDGLTSTAKQKKVLEATGLSRSSLSALRRGDGLDSQKTAALLAALKAHSKSVKPVALGIITKQHFQARFAEMGADLSTFKYSKAVGVTDDLPWVVETAFAYRPDATGQRLITGVNWSPGIVNPFRTLGTFGQSLDAILAQARAGAHEPILLALHLSCPRVEYTDRGKSAIVIAGQPTEEDDDEA
jgi:DNA topoisomerase VI subunit B